MNTKLNHQLIVSSLVGIEIIACLLLGNIAIAVPSSMQSIPETPEVELSPEGAKILCEHFPLNSRCQENADSTTPSDSSDPITTETPPSDTTSPSVPDASPTPPSPIEDSTIPGSLPGNPTTPPPL